MVASSGRICNHRALCTVCIVRQEYTGGPDNMDGLTLSASFADRATDDCPSEFSLRLFGPSGRREAASGPGNSESRNR
jgi:hypothetical protein